MCLAKERSLVMAETESEVWRAGEKIGWEKLREGSTTLCCIYSPNGKS